MILLGLLSSAAAFSPSARQSSWQKTSRNRAAVIVALDQATAASALQSAQAAALEKVTGTLGLYEREPFQSSTGSVRSFANEAPIADSAELGLEESRRIASGEVKRTTAEKSEVAWCSALNLGGAPPAAESA